MSNYTLKIPMSVPYILACAVCGAAESHYWAGFFLFLFVVAKRQENAQSE